MRRCSRGCTSGFNEGALEGAHLGLIVSFLRFPLVNVEMNDDDDFELDNLYSAIL